MFETESESSPGGKKKDSLESEGGHRIGLLVAFLIEGEKPKRRRTRRVQTFFECREEREVSRRKLMRVGGKVNKSPRNRWSKPQNYERRKKMPPEKEKEEVSREKGDRYRRQTRFGKGGEGAFY